MTRPKTLPCRAAFWITALSGALVCAAPPELTPVDARRFPHLYRWTDTCNVYVLRQDDAALLIDLGDGSVLDHLSGIGVRTVDWVLLTHHHREQCQGHARLGGSTRIAAPDVECAFLEEPASFRKMVPRLGDPFTVYGASYLRPPISPIELDQAFVEGDVLEWRGHSLRVLSTPGHTCQGTSPLTKSGDGNPHESSPSVCLSFRASFRGSEGDR